MCFTLSGIQIRIFLCPYRQLTSANLSWIQPFRGQIIGKGKNKDFNLFRKKPKNALIHSLRLQDINF